MDKMSSSYGGKFFVEHGESTLKNQNKKLGERIAFSTHRVTGSRVCRLVGHEF